MQKNKIILYFFLIIITIIINYYLPFLKIYYFSIILFQFYRSKNYPFWFSFFFFIINAPGGLFPQGSADDLIVIPALRNMHIFELVMIISFFKALKTKKKTSPLFFQKYLLLFTIIFIFLYLYGITLGLEPIKNLYIARHILVFTFFYSIPRLFKIEDFRLFFYYSFPGVFIIFFTQIIEIILGINIAGILGHNIRLFDPESGTLRQLYGPFYILLCQIGAMFYLLKRDKLFKESYLNLIIFVGIFSLFINATRGYFLASLLLFSFYIIIFKKVNIKYLFVSFIFLFSLTVLMKRVPKIEIQLINAYERIMTIQYMAKGDITLGGKLRRTTIRAPRVLSKWEESPLIGFGFSDVYFKYDDVHVAFPTLMLNGGIALLMMVIIFLMFLIFYPYFIYKKLNNNNIYKKSIIIFIGGLMSLILLNSTSTTIFSYLVGFRNGGFMLIFFLVFFDVIIKESIIFEKNIYKKKKI